MATHEIATMNAEKGMRWDAYIKTCREFLSTCSVGGSRTIALQETTPQMIEAICKEAEWDYRFVPKCIFRGQYRGTEYDIVQGIGTITTSTIGESGVYMYDSYVGNRESGLPVQTGNGDEDAADFMLLWTQIGENEQKIDMLNTHGIWTQRGVSTDRQVAGICKMISHITEIFDTCILVGDFNMPKFYRGDATKPNPTYEKMIKAGFVDCLPESMITTLNPKEHRGGANVDDVVVDYIFSYGEVNIESVHAIEIPSDHLGIFAKAK